MRVREMRKWIDWSSNSTAILESSTMSLSVFGRLITQFEQVVCSLELTC